MCDHISSQSVTKDIPNNVPVYKDDCMYNFDTAENNPKGLDVCLSCFRAYSRGDINYTSQHTKVSNHGLFLNIIKQLKPESERRELGDGPREPKMAKLEVKELKDEEIYDIQYRIYCSQDDELFELKDVPEVFEQLTQNIITANSSHRQEEIKAWEQEIIACEHSIEIDQVAIKVDLTKCSQCELDVNLWICLHCGALGCGRQQFGSDVPGNSHALKHFEDSGHPVAVKLGSLSATEIDNYDAYCYKCNDEVRIPNLVQYLQTYDIDLSNAIKTEKNLIELNLDQNMNWQFQLDGKNGEKLKPIFGPNFTGLTNLGNSCYLNSVVQGLFDLSPYLEFFHSQTFPSYEEVPDPSKNLQSQMLKIYDGLVSGRYSKPNELKGDEYQLGIKPTMFKSLIGEDHVEFKTNKQQDAFEFLTYLLDKLDKHFGLGLNSHFKFLMTNKILCSQCLKGTANDELVDNLAVNIEDVVIGMEDDKKIHKEVKLIDSFKEYCEDEVIEGYQCDKCHNKTEAIKSSGFKTFPDYLIVNAKRIKLQNWVPVKIDVPIEVPETLDLSSFKVEIDDNFEIEQSESKGFEPQPEILSNLEDMGFPKPRCIKALYNTGNNSLDEASIWLVEHMDDPDIDEPLDVEAKPEISEEAINNLVQMGFSYQLSKKALVLNEDPNYAIEWLFNHPDDDGVIVEPVDLGKEKKELIESLNKSTNNGKYNLRSVICHKGTSPHTGHYVIFIKKTINGKEKWVLYNDEKVVECDESSLDDMKVNGYIYIFERCT